MDTRCNSDVTNNDNALLTFSFAMPVVFRLSFYICQQRDKIDMYINECKTGKRRQITVS